MTQREYKLSKYSLQLEKSSVSRAMDVFQVTTSPDVPCRTSSHHHVCPFTDLAFSGQPYRPNPGVAVTQYQEVWNASSFLPTQQQVNGNRSVPWMTRRQTIEKNTSCEVDYSSLFASKQMAWIQQHSCHRGVRLDWKAIFL